MHVSFFLLTTHVHVESNNTINENALPKIKLHINTYIRGQGWDSGTEFFDLGSICHGSSGLKIGQKKRKVCVGVLGVAPMAD